MNQMTITTEKVAEYILSSYKLMNDCFKTRDEHINDILAIRSFVGDAFYDEAAEIARNKAIESGLVKE